MNDHYYGLTGYGDRWPVNRPTDSRTRVIPWDDQSYTNLRAQYNIEQ